MAMDFSKRRISLEFFDIKIVYVNIYPVANLQTLFLLIFYKFFAYTGMPLPFDTEIGHLLHNN